MPSSATIQRKCACNKPNFHNRESPWPAFPPRRTAFDTTPDFSVKSTFWKNCKIHIPDGYEFFHSVAMHTLSSNAEHHGEIDLIVLGPSSAILLLEVKAGDVSLRDGGIFKAYRNQEHDNVRQTQTQYAAMRNRLGGCRVASVTSIRVWADPYS